MASVRLPRFRRAVEAVARMQLTRRDQAIIALVHQHRFLRSSHITALIGDSSPQLLRRLHLLFHHGFLERPRAQIDYYHQGGSRPMVYGLGNKGAELLRLQLDWPDLNRDGNNRFVGRLFLEHALLISDVMVALELACRASQKFRFVDAADFPLPPKIERHREPFRWSVKVGGRWEVGLIPDAVFALQSTADLQDVAFFFLEADRGTMPVTRSTLAQSSFYRKLLAYEATWKQNLHRTRFGFHRFRVLTVTMSPARAQNLAEAAAGLERGRGLFLFTDLSSFLDHPLERPGVEHASK